ncbi:MAG: site-specific integrase, partial [Actinomycetota bacterium]|jgi:integrase|nr:site-specific integrase [Actinomycetota bacterium]
MGRPLTGSLRRYQGLWWASVPEAKGATRRRDESFLAEDDAQAWLAQAVTAVRAGRPLPDADRFRTRKPATRPKAAARPEPRKISPDVASVAQAWMAAAYEDLRRGGPERAERVRRIVEGHLVPWFAPRTTTITDVSYLMAHEWLLRLVGRDRPGSTGCSLSWLAPVTSDERDGELGLVGAAEAAGVSLPTVRRRWRAGQLPGAYRDEVGRVRVPVAAVAGITTKAKAPAGLSQGYVADALWVLRRILAFARANGLFPPGFDPTEGLDAPLADKAAARNAPRGGQPRPLTLGECARLASHLHPVHQLAFWIQRIMGLRISEAFGITVADVVDLGDTGLLAVQSQGGRTFTVRDDHGQIVAVPYKPTLKTAAGSRVLVVPPKLMELIRVAIEAFHTDPDTGEIDTTARLVPGLRSPNCSGQHAYRHAFEEAATTEQLSSDHLGFSVSTHLLRKSCATDLAWTVGIEDAVRRRFMGHRAGEDVFGRIYTLDHPDVAPLAKVAEIFDHNIAITIGGLLTPTVRRVHWGAGNPTLARADHIDATLAAAGWLVEPGNADDPLCDAQRVAAELDIYPTTARRWMTDGTIPTVAVPDATGVSRRHSRLSDIWQLRDHLAGQILLPDLAHDLGLRYHEAYNMLRRLGLEGEPRPGNGDYQLTPEAADALRVEHQRVQALHRRSMKLAAAARALKVALSTAALMSRTGQLDVDLETDSSRARFVARASVEECWLVS